MPIPSETFDLNRGSARERGYSVEWDRASAAFRREHPLCLGCQAVGRVTTATVVDHVDPHKGDMAKFWNSDQWQACCAWHHNVVKKRLEWMFDQRQIDASSLRLDSPEAVRLTRAMSESIGADGWPR